MIHLLWSILNVIVGVYFIVMLIGLLFKGRKIFRGKLRYITMLVFSIAVLQLAAEKSREKEEKNDTVVLLEDFDAKDLQDIKVVVDNYTPTFDVTIMVDYMLIDDELVPVAVQSYLTGFVAGHEWEMDAASLNESVIDGRTEYIVEGRLTWLLFGIDVHTEQVTLRGFLE